MALKNDFLDYNLSVCPWPCLTVDAFRMCVNAGIGRPRWKKTRNPILDLTNSGWARNEMRTRIDLIFDYLHII